MKKILFISTHNFATNPRLVKEIDLALENNFRVAVLCCAFDNWSKSNNEKIKERLKPQINYYEISGNRKPFFQWFLSTFWSSFSKFLLVFFPENRYLLSLHSNKRSWLLFQHLKKIKEKPDMVIAHNPGSFYPAQLFAEKNKIPFGIDLEDYHPGETNDQKEIGFSKSLLKLILPKAAYITAASPLILEETRKVAGGFSCEAEIVLNYFSREEFIAPAENNCDKLQLVWFSQNIAKGRGLEEVIPAIKKNDRVELHLYGNLEPQFYKDWIEGTGNIFMHAPLQQSELHKELSLYDVGLAIEKPSSNFNRDICLTNKLLAYFQAGLFILASETSAQKKFIEKYPGHGMLSSLSNNDDLETAFQKLAANKNAFRFTAKERFEKANNSSWENESQKLLLTWKQILN